METVKLGIRYRPGGGTDPESVGGKLVTVGSAGGMRQFRNGWAAGYRTG